MDKINALKKLKALLEEGIITEEEFKREKYRILNGDAGDNPEAEKAKELQPNGYINQTPPKDEPKPENEVKHNVVSSTRPEKKHPEETIAANPYLKWGIIGGVAFLLIIMLFLTVKNSRDYTDNDPIILEDDNSFNTNTSGSRVKTMEEHANSPAVPAQDYVDLGLSVNWATCNVGANKPQDYGNYYAWGETSTKSDYSPETYSMRIGGGFTKMTINKYNTSTSYGNVDNKTKLELSDDAARQAWKGKWRIPSQKEWEELIESCSWNWTNGGYTGISKINGKSIFFPAAGYGGDGKVGNNSYHPSGIYWSSSLDSKYPDHAIKMTFEQGVMLPGIMSGSRYYGYSVRPVCDK